MNKLRFRLLTLLVFCVVCANAQNKWHYNFGLGASLNAGNVNNCNISNDGAVERNDSLVAFDAHYKLLYSSLIDKSGGDKHWKETNFEVNGGVKIDLFQHDKYSPFLACEMLTNKYKGYDLRLSGLVGMKYRIYTIPRLCDYSISAAFVYDWADFTDDTHLPNNNYRISIRPKVKQKLAEIDEMVCEKHRSQKQVLKYWDEIKETAESTNSFFNDIGNSFKGFFNRNKK